LIAPLLGVFGRIEAKDLELEYQDPVARGDAGAGGFGKEERKLKFAFAQVFDVQDELTENQTGEI